MKRSILAVAACAALLVVVLVGSSVAQDRAAAPAANDNGRYQMFSGKVDGLDQERTFLLDTRTGGAYVIGHDKDGYRRIPFAADKRDE